MLSADVGEPFTASYARKVSKYRPIILSRTAVSEAVSPCHSYQNVGPSSRRSRPSDGSSHSAPSNSDGYVTNPLPAWTRAWAVSECERNPPLASR